MEQQKYEKPHLDALYYCKFLSQLPLREDMAKKMAQSVRSTQVACSKYQSPSLTFFSMGVLQAKSRREY